MVNPLSKGKEIAKMTETKGKNEPNFHKYSHHPII
jgi:hypothetical protein